MGTLILLPNHPDYPYKRTKSEGSSQPLLEEVVSPIPVVDDNNEPLSREELRAYMLLCSVKGNVTMPRRTPFVGETKPFVSPIDTETKFVIRRLSIQQVMLYRDRNSVIRYVTESAGENNERYITERDYPTGTMTLDVATFGLASWNIQDEDGKDLKINEDTIKRYLDPEELDFVAEKVFEVNPILRGNQKSRTDEDSGSSDGSDSRGDEPPTVSQLLQDARNGNGDLSGDQLPSSLSLDVDGSETTGKSNERGKRVSRTK